MIRLYCDMCGKTLDIDKNLVQLDFNGYAQAGNDLLEKTNQIKPEFQLCVECAYSVCRHIKLRQKNKGREIHEPDNDG